VNVDTGEFRAISSRLDGLTGQLAELGDRVEQTTAVEAILARAGLAPAGRHARPRRDRHGLRLIPGGDART
jgi:hypothetical protein